MTITALLDELGIEREKYEKSVLRNGVQDFAQYKYLIGHIDGLDNAIAICRNMFRGKNNE